MKCILSSSIWFKFKIGTGIIKNKVVVLLFSSGKQFISRKYDNDIKYRLIC